MNDLANISVADFYQNSGQALVDEANYPPAIASHLGEEKSVLTDLLRQGGYTAAVEVGCMDGCLHMETILATDLRYLGIDLVPDSVAQLNRRLHERPFRNERAHALVMDVGDLSILRKTLGKERTLVVFPFNSFGNLDEPIRAIREVQKCCADLLILTYGTDQTSTQLRREYYDRCGYTSVDLLQDDHGMLFTSPEGLHSYAYHETWIRDHFRRHAFGCNKQMFGRLGIAYWGMKTRRRVSHWTKGLTKHICLKRTHFQRNETTADPMVPLTSRRQPA